MSDDKNKDKSKNEDHDQIKSTDQPQESNQKSKRRLRNILIMPKAQVGLVVNIIILTVCFSLAASFVVYFQMDHLFDKLFQLSYLDEETTGALRHTWNISVQWLSMFIILYLVAVTSILIIHTHRMVGPSEAFKRHLSALLGGDYSVRVKLREGDSYQNIAELLNRVTEKLDTEKKEAKQKSSSS